MLNLNSFFLPTLNGKFLRKIFFHKKIKSTKDLENQPFSLYDYFFDYSASRTALPFDSFNQPSGSGAP